MRGIDLIQDLGLVMLVAAAAAWLCQRIGLPAVIGYLGAGVLMSPHTHSFGLISDVNRIQELAQIGLVFLIFSIGQGLTLQRLRRVGWPMILGTVLIAIFVLAGCRWIGTMFGWPSEHSLVLGAILMVSSTAVLRKSLRAARQTNTTFGQTALTVTALDDVVAIVMLTVLTALIQAGGAETATVVGTVMRANAVIVAMLFVALLLIPPLLKRVARGSSEVSALIIAGILLGMALLSAKAGFSAALGAFLLGTIVASSGSADQGRSLASLCDVFGPVFFVAMGMLLNLEILVDAWPLVAGVIALVFLLRIAAGTIALLMVGQSVSDASRAAICLTPIGEFSLILALTGVQGGIVPETFYAVAVGVCLFTAITTPVLIRHSRSASEWIEGRQPRVLAELLGLYHEWIENLKQRRNASLLWRLTAPRIVQLAILVMFISGLLTFAAPFYFWTQKWLRPDWQLNQAVPTVFWSIFAGLIVAPLIAAWRQIEALAMICAEAVTKSRQRRPILRPLFEKLLRGVATTGIVLWFATLMPYEALSAEGLMLLALGLVAIAAIFWRRLIRLHSRFEIELKAQLAESPFSADKPQLPGWPKRNGHWKMSLAEVVLNHGTSAAGLKIIDLPIRADFGCTIVRIERQGILLANPGAETVLFPNDKLLLLGTEKNLAAAEEWLNARKEDREAPGQPTLAELSLGHLMVPPSSRYIGKSLVELGIRPLFGIQVVGIERGERSVLSPGPKESLASGDQLLVLGTPEQVSDMAVWLSN